MYSSERKIAQRTWPANMSRLLLSLTPISPTPISPPPLENFIPTIPLEPLQINTNTTNPMTRNMSTYVHPPTPCLPPPPTPPTTPSFLFLQNSPLIPTSYNRTTFLDFGSFNNQLTTNYTNQQSFLPHIQYIPVQEPFLVQAELTTENTWIHKPGITLRQKQAVYFLPTFGVAKKVVYLKVPANHTVIVKVDPTHDSTSPETFYLNQHGTLKIDGKFILKRQFFGEMKPIPHLTVIQPEVDYVHG